MTSSELSELVKAAQTLDLDTLDELSRTIVAKRMERDDPVAWMERHFVIEDTEKPIILAPHQKAILSYALKRDEDGRLPFTTIIWSAPKKSGKTAIAGAVTRWAAETWGRYGEILCVGNDAEQAKERAFKASRISIELTEGYNPATQMLGNRWHILTKEAKCLTTGTVVKAIATDYKGEAGANPILVVWTELWGFTLTRDLRFWAEMAPSPTRPDSLQWIETYAGYEGESELLWRLYDDVVLNGRQLTAGELGDLGAFEEAPNEDDPVPCYVNDRAGVFAYWDEGTQARRMPWQKGARGEKYYAGEATRQTGSQMVRLHNNSWVSAESQFIQIEWWEAAVNPMPLRPQERTPLVIALDAAVTGDCFGLVAMSRTPEKATPPNLAVRFVQKWDPPPGGAISYRGPEKVVRQLCLDYNVVQVAYDPFQLHDFATRLQQEGVAWFRPFSQAQERLIADKGLYDLIVARRIRHDGNLELREHLTNANAKQAANEDTRLRIVKKSDTRKIDLAVCLSMGSKELLRLNL
jgi:phage terminase large subunit-like protein